MAKCGDCIHADICKEVNGGWFSPENIAYCKGFKDRINYVEVVRCKDCKHFGGHGACHCHAANVWLAKYVQRRTDNA